MFEGFTPETVDFLWGIRLNNNREWFLEHKPQYRTTLYEPIKALGAELFAPFVDKPGELLKVSRIYRDARMHHPLPYKESLWICIRRDVEWWAENPCLFFEINPEGVDYGFILWKPKPTAMKAFRHAIAQKPKEFCKIVDNAEKRLGMEISAEHYKRPEACPDPKLERFYLWKSNIALVRHEDFGPDSFGPGLKDRVSDFFDALIPLYNYFNQFLL